MGKHYGTEDEDIIDDSLKMIKSDQHVAGKVAGTRSGEVWRKGAGGQTEP